MTSPQDSHRGIQDERDSGRGPLVTRRRVLAVLGGGAAAGVAVGGDDAIDYLDGDDARNALEAEYNVAVEVTDGFVDRATAAAGGEDYAQLVADLTAAYDDLEDDEDLYLGGTQRVSAEGLGYAWDGRVAAEEALDAAAFHGETYGDDTRQLAAAVDPDEQWTYDDSGILPFHY